MALSSWLYVSSSQLSTAEAPTEVEEIVAMSLERNGVLQVTGALLFTGLRFAQFIEGPVSGVTAIRASIMRDSRHDRIITLNHTHTNDRIFPKWSLAYGGPSKLVAKVIHDAIAVAEENTLQATRNIIRLLQSFSSNT